MTKSYELMTDEQIEALRREAAWADDQALIAVCDVALGRDPYAEISRDLIAERRAGLDRARVSDTASARAECARVIAEAQAQG